MSRAGTGARDQVARLLTLVPLLHSRGDLPLAEAAQTLGTTPQQVLKDLRVLWMCGLPGGYPDDLIDVDMDALTDADGDGTIRVWNADYLARPVRLSPTEASALIVALRALRDSAGTVSQDVLDRALAKLEKAAADGASTVEVDRAHVTTAQDGVLRDVQESLAAGRQVRLTYWVPSRDERTTRVVDPHHVVTQQGVTYLEAFCHTAGDRRTFRLDRVLDVQPLAEPVTTAPQPVPRLLSEALFEGGDSSSRTTLLLDEPARWVASYHPVHDAEEMPDGRLRVTMSVQSDQWLSQLLLRLAPHASTLAPDASAEALTEARRALAHYAAP